MCMCTMCELGALGDQKRPTGPLGLELELLVSVGNRTNRSANVFNPLSHLSRSLKNLNYIYFFCVRSRTPLPWSLLVKVKRQLLGVGSFLPPTIRVPPTQGSNRLSGLIARTFFFFFP